MLPGTAMLSSLSNILQVLFLTAFLVSISHAARADFVSLRAPNFFHPHAIRNEISNTSLNEAEVVLLQEDGSVDYMKIFVLDIPEDVTPEDIIFKQMSSDAHVLNITNNKNLLTSSSTRTALNITSTLSFDNFVGKTEYSLAMIRESTGEVISTVVVPYTIVGITLFLKESESSYKIISGQGRKYVAPYEALLDRKVSDEQKIRAHIQYPNGSFVSNLTQSRSILFGDSIQVSPEKLRAQCNHDASVCTVTKLGTMTQNSSLKFSQGCGFGFYEDLSGELCFGFLFEPYRSGSFLVQFRWSGLTSSYAPLAEEVFELALNVEISGVPPIAITGVVPDHGLLRPEGGQALKLNFFNADLYNISSYFIEVHNVTNSFLPISGTYTDFELPTFAQTLSFMSQSGYGTSLNWTLFYHVDTAVGGILSRRLDQAVFVPELISLFSYDPRPLFIDSINPEQGKEGGGDVIQIKGYFPHFDANEDNLFFSSVKIPKQYFISQSKDLIEIRSPPRSILGSSYEYLAFLKMGYGRSNSQAFWYIITQGIVRISQSGTSEIAESTYRVGDCTDVSFTAIVIPFSPQIRSYSWNLYLSGDLETDLLKTSNFSSAISSGQTLELNPSWFGPGLYSLKLSVVLIGTVMEREIFLLREHVVTIGAFILKPPDRYIASPDTPLRLSAVVRPPGSCYSGNSNMIFEWEAFGRVQRFSSSNTTGSPATGALKDTPARLGWEYVVPRESLTSGNHSLTFRVWMRDQDEVVGQAQSHVIVKASPLVAVIREGEEFLTVNYQTTLNMYANNSYDPDVLEGQRNKQLSYEWLCRQSSTNNFTVEASQPCADVLLPGKATAAFAIPVRFVESLTNVSYIQYALVISKGMNRKSSTQKLTVEIHKGGANPMLQDYSITLVNVDDMVLDWNLVPHYEKTIIRVDAGLNATWSYELIEPSVPDFFSSKVIKNPLFYSEEANIFSVSGNRKPLGIEAGKLSPSTTYRFRIKFEATENASKTSITFALHTVDAPSVQVPIPSVTNGTTQTVFTATAGIPSTRSAFSYYFIMTDEDGNESCLGGCTGYSVIYFQIGRPGSYSLRALLYDMQGKALLDSVTLSKNITVHKSKETLDYKSHLNILFNYGDDNRWTQLAHDLALELLGSNSTTANGTASRALLMDRQAASPEDILDARMQYSFELSSGSRKIYCNSFPNSYHGRDCLSFALSLSQQPSLDEMTVYNIIQTVECCIKNTPLRTIHLMGSQFSPFLKELNRLALNLYQGGNSRRRLLSSTGEPANAVADVQGFTGAQYAEASTSGKLDGFVAKLDVGSTGEYGQVTVVVASNPSHLPAQVINGERRKILMGPSENELFFAKDECLVDIFSAKADERFIFVMHTTENFVLLGFQDPPTRSNLADKLYWTQIYRRDRTGAFVPVDISGKDYCFCWRIPVLRKKEFLEDSVDSMPGLYAVTDFKSFNKSVVSKGSAYSYVYEKSKTRDYNASEGWMEGCREKVGLVGATIVSRTSANIIANLANGRIFGVGGSVIVGLVIGGLMLLVVAMAASWLIAVRAMSDGVVPLVSLVPNELYVERDPYGRGTIFDANATALPAAN